MLNFPRTAARNLPLTVCLALACGLSAPAEAQLFKSKKAAEAEAVVNSEPVPPAPIGIPGGRASIPRDLALLNAPAAGNPLAAFWRDAEFVKSFAGSYGYHSDIEPPKLTLNTNIVIGGTNEVAFYNNRLYPHITNDNSKAAIALLTTNVTADSNARFDYLLGNLHFQNNEMAAAAKHFRAAIEKFPDYRNAHKNLGLSLVGLEKFDEAIDAFSRTVELGGGDGHVYGLLGVCHLRRGNHMAAEGAYRNAAMFQPNQKDWKMGLLTCQIEQGQLEAANRYLETLLARDPSNARLWETQAGLHMQMDRPKEAAINYEILRKLGAADLADLMLLGDIYMSQDSPALALAVYRDAIKKDGVKDIKRSLRAARLLSNSGAFKEAATLFADIRRIHGGKIADDEELELLKLESKVALAEGEGEKAIAVLQKVVARNPLDGEALLMVGDYHASAGENEKAANRFEMASKIKGFEADAHVKSAQLLVKERKYEKALEFLNKAQKIKPRESIQRYLEAVQRAHRGTRS